MGINHLKLVNMASVWASFSLHALNYETPPSYHDSHMLATFYFLESFRETSMRERDITTTPMKIHVTMSILRIIPEIVCFGGLWKVQSMM